MGELEGGGWKMGDGIDGNWEEGEDGSWRDYLVWGKGLTARL